MLAIMAISTYLGAVAKALDEVSVVSAKHSSRRHFLRCHVQAAPTLTPCRVQLLGGNTRGIRLTLPNLNCKPLLPFAVSKRKTLFMIKIKHFDRQALLGTQ